MSHSDHDHSQHSHDSPNKPADPHGHDHNLAAASESSLRWALLLTGGLMITEAIGGWLTHSLALLSDAAHMLTDTAALAIALAAIKISRKPADLRRTYGYARFEILAAAFNAIVLFLVALYILWEAIDRFRQPPEVHSGSMMAIAALGLCVNLISMRVLSSHSHTSLNMKSAYLEVYSDMLGSIGVLIAGAIIYFTGWQAVDPIIAVAIGLWVLPRTWTILKHSLNILLEGVPAGVDPAEICTTIESVTGVSRIHDLHVWTVQGNQLLLTAHVERPAISDPDDETVLREIHQVLKERHNITHSTIQMEHNPCGTPDCREEHTHPRTDA